MLEELPGTDPQIWARPEQKVAATFHNEHLQKSCAKMSVINTWLKSGNNISLIFLLQEGRLYLEKTQKFNFLKFIWQFEQWKIKTKCFAEHFCQLSPPQKRSIGPKYFWTVIEITLHPHTLHSWPRWHMKDIGHQYLFFKGGTWRSVVYARLD